MIPYKISKYQIAFITIIILCFLQSGLEKIWSGFSYIDEAIAGSMFILTVIKTGQVKKTVAHRSFLIVALALGIFVFSGFWGNLVYNYQPLKIVFIDFLTNTKFFLALGAGYLFFEVCKWNCIEQVVLATVKKLTILLFVVWLLDRVFNIWDGQIRYGLKSSVLFFSHPTYLAAALAFSLALMVFCGHKNCQGYILMNLAMLVSTLRSKAFATAVVFVALYWYILLRKRVLKLWQIILVMLIAAFGAWNQVSFYFFQLGGRSARSVLTLTSVYILRDYFPFGTGFGTFASHVAGQYYSPVYVKYGFLDVYELMPTNPQAFFDDTFWPIILGQTGVIGACAYLFVLVRLTQKCLRLEKGCYDLYMCGIFCMLYLFISSAAEPSFNNSVAVPFAFLLGCILKRKAVQPMRY